MLIYPAIDMLAGRVVRLYQGDYNKVKIYGDDPAGFCKEFAKKGATHLHMVDLDGARQGAPQHFGAVRAITSACDIFIELGGGIRDEETVRRCFTAGVGRVVLGTSALRNPQLVKKLVESYGEKIGVAVDARDGKVAIDGWLSTSDVDSFEFCQEMKNIGVKYINYTDISRDGASKGSNLAAYEKLSQLSDVCILAAGGVSTLEEIAALRDMGLYGAILGTALYTGAIDLVRAIEVAAG